VMVVLLGGGIGEAAPSEGICPAETGTDSTHSTVIVIAKRFMNVSP
jgi:hypothetical protein